MLLPPFFLALFDGILLAPVQAEEAPTLKNRGSLLYPRTSLSGLPVNFAAVDGTCDVGSVRCNDHCMPEGKVCCASGGNCDKGQTCTADGFCSDGPDCDPGTAACGSRCMPSDAVCCEGGNYCDAEQICVEGGSCRKGDDDSGGGNDEAVATSVPQATTSGLGGTSGEPRTTATDRGTKSPEDPSKSVPTRFKEFGIETLSSAAPTTTSALAGVPRGAYVNHAALVVGLCAAMPLVI
ncbi:hypothetical protein LZ30DRAFT_352162 [Colletotrichum cereale]|nr:hypothetical protein LZ30DRAFT_352162 [Colletotrichum cereale]